jgi:hypothetical protein
MTKLTSDNQLSDLSSLLKKMRQTYLVEYAYPTSSLAKKLGFEGEGCWYVSALVDGKTTNPAAWLRKVSPRRSLLSRSATISLVGSH